MGIPLSHDIILMTERFRREGYHVTVDDKALYLKSKIQEDMHRVATIFLFAGTVGIEIFALTVSLVHFFNSNGSHDVVNWGHKTPASIAWLALTLTRCLTFLGV